MTKKDFDWTYIELASDELFETPKMSSLSQIGKLGLKTEKDYKAKMTKKELQEELTKIDGEQFFILDFNGEKLIGTLSADYYIGITLQDLNDKERYLLCGYGEYAPQSNYYDKDYTEKMYELIIKYCKEPFIDMKKLCEEASVFGKIGTDASVESCPFS